MCTGLEIAAMIGGPLLSAAGGAITASEQNKNAQRMAEARNERLRAALTKNDALAEKSRATFNERAAKTNQQQMDQELQTSQDARTQELQQSVDQTPSPAANVSLAGDAPKVVQSEFAKRIGDAMNESKAKAGRLGDLAGYGDMWANQGFADNEANRNIAQDANFAAGNWAILPYQQDIAETRAYKPISPLGGLLQGLGGMASSYGGGGMVPKKPKVPTSYWQSNAGLW